MQSKAKICKTNCFFMIKERQVTKLLLGIYVGMSVFISIKGKYDTSKIMIVD